MTAQPTLSRGGTRWRSWARGDHGSASWRRSSWSSRRGPQSHTGGPPLTARRPAPGVQPPDLVFGVPSRATSARWPSPMCGGRPPSGHRATASHALACSAPRLRWPGVGLARSTGRSTWAGPRSCWPAPRHSPGCRRRDRRPRGVGRLGPGAVPGVADPRDEPGPWAPAGQRSLTGSICPRSWCIHARVGRGSSE